MSMKYSSNISRAWQRVMTVFVTLVMIATQATFVTATVQAQPDAAPLAASNTLTLSVISARTEPHAFGGAGVIKGDPITQFKYILNIDNTGTTEQRSPVAGFGCSPQDAGYPESCNWPSIGSNVDQSPIYSHGDQDDFNGVNGSGLDLPDGRYLISVLADGYKLDGAHFTVPLAGSGLVTVELQPNPLPDSTIKALVFADNATTNGTQDVPAEPGLAGFVGHINDILGEVTTDVYGNPLCTTYVGEDPVTHVIPFASLDGDMLPIVDALGGECLSDADGILTIPHLGSNRYTTYVIPPDGQTWIQTTTLEGNHDWDTWVMEGSTGFDTEFVQAGEPVPQPIFGFVQPANTLSGGSGHIKGQVNAFKHYTPPKGGTFDPWGGHVGAKVADPIYKPWLSLADLQAGDVAVWVGQGNADGSFDIGGVPDGNYTLSWWDEPQNYNLNFINVTVSGGTVDLGVLPLNGWWTKYDGYVFIDANRNGVRDAGEQGVPNFTLTMRRRENTLMDRGQTTVTTDLNGYYLFESAYPLGEWVIMEAYSDNFYTTGVTYQADNQPAPTTVLGAGVDVSVLPIIGLSGSMDWGVHPYDPTGANGIDPRNGGIVGTVSYGTTRNELDPRYFAAEDWQPGISGLTVELWAPVDCGTTGAPCDPLDLYELAPDGSYAKGQLLNTYVTESWARPTGCTARDVDGNPLVHSVDEQVLATNQETDGTCIESFMQEIQYAPYPTDQGTPDANFGAAVDGNYGFGDGCFSGTLDATDPSNPVCNGGTFDPLPAGDYLVHVDIPNDVSGKPMYTVTREEDINIGNGDQIIPQVPPPACAGALHTVDVAGMGTDGYPAVDLFGDGSVVVPESTPVDNATFVDIGGSPFEGLPKPLCDTKLVGLNNGKSIAPIFEVFTDVPIPSRLRGLVVDDTFFSTDPRSTMYGEKSGVPFAPVGVYDFTNRLVTTLESDFNGYYDVLLPSTNHISCPTPTGVCANMYRFVANDPGIPGRLNPNWKPEYRTIATEFEAFPGMIIPTDLAPTQVGLRIEGPSGLLPAMCTLDSATPQLFAVSQPYVNGSGSFTIDGLGFGTQGAGSSVRLDNTILPTTSWSDTHIAVTVPTGTPIGPHQLSITAANGQSTVNGLTFHVLGAGYNPNLYEVGPGRTFGAIQDAIDAAVASNGNDLVVVYPGLPNLSNPRLNPLGAYYENLILTTPLKLQGVGPGGFQGNTFVPGSIVDGSAFGGDTALATAWFTKVAGLTWDGNQAVNDGEVIYILARDGVFTSAFKASIDGFDIRGGDQQGFPGNINDLTGGPTGLPPGIVTQGGAIFANAYARYLQVTNNVVQNNGGGYGTIRIGTPDLPAPDTNQHNENIRIANNRIIKNAGTNLAGGIGLFAGADNYEVTRNDICGNYSVEYGGGLSVYGRSPNGKIHHNRIYFNQSNDEGGGIMIAGELPATPGALSPGSGPVDIYNNQIQANMANDDGGGLRFLMAGGAGGVDAMNVYNNMIVNNVSTHEGGGIGLNDAPNVRIFNNTIMKNLSTATAVTSNGQPAPAGLSTSANSGQLQVTLPGGAPSFSNPLLFNNIFWDNRAGTRAGTTVTGIGLVGDATPIDEWDMGVADGTGVLAPTNSVVQQSAHPYTDSASNSHSDPTVVSPYDVSVSFATWAQNPAFVGATLVTLEAPPNLLGDYHLQAGSPAIDLGVASQSGVNAPATDFDDGARPAGAAFDSGADEYGADAPPPSPPMPTLYFSTVGNVFVPGVAAIAPPAGGYDNADIYSWDGTSFSRVFDATVSGSIPLPASANIDGLVYVDATHFYLSFSGDVTISGFGTVQDEDVVYYNNGTWSVYFDGTAHGLTATAQDLDAINIIGNMLYFSTVGAGAIPGVAGPYDDADIYTWNGTSFGRVFDASLAGLPTNANVDGLNWVDTNHFYLSFSSTTTTVPGLGSVQDEDIVQYASGVWSVFFDGTAQGLGASDSQDLDAFSFVANASPPPPPPPPPPPAETLYFSTAGDAFVPGVAAISPPTLGYDNADIYSWNGTSFSRVFDANVGSNLPLPNGANIDGLMLVDATHFYLSFTSDVTISGFGTVQDEDVVYYNNGAWSVYFDGTGAGLTNNAQDLDAFNIVGSTLYFSTIGNVLPPGVGGTADDADIYAWNGTSFSRVFDASLAGLPGNANVNGLVWIDANNFYLSFSATTTTVPGLGSVEDEDIVQYTSGIWSVFFDGTAHGLNTSNAQDLDAFSFMP